MLGYELLPDMTTRRQVASPSIPVPRQLPDCLEVQVASLVELAIPTTAPHCSRALASEQTRTSAALASCHICSEHRFSSAEYRMTQKGFCCSSNSLHDAQAL